MAVLIIAEVQGQTQPGYDGMAERLGPALRSAPGFIAHVAHPVDGGLRIVQIWRDKDRPDRVFAQHVAPNLPPGIRPKRSLQVLHNLVLP